jgi:hypothetical protein
MISNMDEVVAESFFVLVNAARYFGVPTEARQSRPHLRNTSNGGSTPSKRDSPNILTRT